MCLMFVHSDKDFVVNGSEAGSSCQKCFCVCLTIRVTTWGPVNIAKVAGSCFVGNVKVGFITPTTEHGAIAAVAIVRIFWVSVLSHDERLKIVYVL